MYVEFPTPSYATLHSLRRSAAHSLSRLLTRSRTRPLASSLMQTITHSLTPSPSAFRACHAGRRDWKRRLRQQILRCSSVFVDNFTKIESDFELDFIPMRQKMQPSFMRWVNRLPALPPSPPPPCPFALYECDASRKNGKRKMPLAPAHTAPFPSLSCKLSEHK